MIKNIIILTSFLATVRSASNTCRSPALADSKCKCDSSEKIIDCRGQDLDSVPSPIPETATTLYLNQNQISSIEDLGDLSNLVTLSLERNNLEKIQFDVFDNMDSLQNLILSYNKLESLDDDTFEWNPLRLEKINLSHNQFKYVQHFLFYDLERIQDIDLSHNNISFIHPHAFQQLKELRILDLSNNHLTTFNPQWINKLGQNGLESINFKDNPWACDCGMDEAFDFLHAEENFWFEEISNAQIICHDNSGKSLSDILSKDDLPCQQPKITGISKPSKIKIGRSVLLRCQATGQPKPVISWIAPNDDVYRLNSDNFKGVKVNEKGDLLITNLKKQDEGKYICQASSNAGAKVTSNVVQVSTRIDIVDDDSHGDTPRVDPEYHAPSKSDAESWHADNHCPTGCSCMTDQIDCSYPQQSADGTFRKKLTKFPRMEDEGLKVLKTVTSLLNMEGNELQGVPAGVCKPFDSLTELRLNENEISMFSPGAFRECHDLKVLTMRKNKLTVIEDDKFKDMPKLEILVLDENEIHTVNKNAFYNLPSLRWLYIRENKIKLINADAFHKVPQLDFVHMEDNFLQHLYIDWIDSLKYQSGGKAKLFLSGNPVNCDCNLLPFYRKKDDWMNKNTEIVDFEEITCNQPMDNRDKSLDDLKEKDLVCGKEQFKDASTDSKGGIHLFFGIGLGMIIAVSAALLWRKYRFGSRIAGPQIYSDIAYRDISAEHYPQTDETQALTQNNNSTGPTEAYI